MTDSTADFYISFLQRAKPTKARHAERIQQILSQPYVTSEEKLKAALEAQRELDLYDALGLAIQKVQYYTLLQQVKERFPFLQFEEGT